MKKLRHDGWGLIRFMINLYGETLELWEKMKMMLDEVQVTADEDKFRWKI
jgi:hypothetical protein